MKITQDSEGRVVIHLSNDEKPNLEDEVNSLLDFVSQQAIVIHRLTASQAQLARRLNKLEVQFEHLLQTLQKD